MDIQWENSSWNLEKAKLWIQGLKNTDTQIAVLPEMFATGFSMNPTKIAQTENDEVVKAMTEIALQTNIAIVFSMATVDEGKYYNRMFFVEPSGLIHRYDKKHLFSMAGENNNYTAGNQHTIVNYKGARLLLLVCYDLRFPVWSRIAQTQADAIIYVASWPQSREHAWKTLLQARAIENQCYVIGVNRTGDDPGNHYSGDSVIIDFMGKYIAQCTPNLECACTAEISIDNLNLFRLNFPAHQDAEQYNIKIN